VSILKNLMHPWMPERDIPEYEQFRDAMLADLAPQGAMEEAIALEIVHNVLRLGDITRQEGRNYDYPCDARDKARARNERTLFRYMREFRALQSNRLLREQLFPNPADRANRGLADERVLSGFPASNCKKEELASGAAAAEAPETAQIPRNAACPCGSGEKYKRCCGQNAAPMLNQAA
jgi:hypothetical protein